ncbi:asparagine--tRNA ligase, partial [bacterium]|nr:asparagine--tRNA ligase [bacterium]
MKRTKINRIFQDALIGKSVRVCGWVRTRRDSKGGFSFIELNDGSCLKNIQIVADSQMPNYSSEILCLSPGCSIAVEGKIVESPGSEQPCEIRAEQISVYGYADPEEYPLQKKRHSFEFLRQIAHLRPRTNTIGAVSRIRNTLSSAIHTFFQERGFSYIHTPIITASDCEGAGDMFRVTTLNMDAPPRTDGSIDFSHDFFGRPSYLTVSGQL